MSKIEIIVLKLLVKPQFDIIRIKYHRSNYNLFIIKIQIRHSNLPTVKFYFSIINIYNLKDKLTKRGQACQIQ